MGIKGRILREIPKELQAKPLGEILDKYRKTLWEKSLEELLLKYREKRLTSYPETLRKTGSTFEYILEGSAGGIWQKKLWKHIGKTSGKNTGRYSNPQKKNTVGILRGSLVDIPGTTLRNRERTPKKKSSKALFLGANT